MVFIRAPIIDRVGPRRRSPIRKRRPPSNGPPRPHPSRNLPPRTNHRSNCPQILSAASRRQERGRTPPFEEMKVRRVHASLIKIEINCSLIFYDRKARFPVVPRSPLRVPVSNCSPWSTEAGELFEYPPERGRKRQVNETSTSAHSCDFENEAACRLPTISQWDGKVENHRSHTSEDQNNADRVEGDQVVTLKMPLECAGPNRFCEQGEQ